MAPGGRATVGLIGFGALARQLVASMPGDLRWTALVRGGETRPAPSNVDFATDLQALIDVRPDAIVEVAGQAAVAAHVPAVLETGIPVIVASVGALADPALRSALLKTGAASGAKLILPSGAVGGLDYLAAIANLPDSRVHYTSRKPLSAFAEEIAERGLGGKAGEIVLFDGSAEEAARRYPKNLNVAMSIALAAHPAPLGVRVVADPAAPGNTHEIDVTSSAGAASLRFANAPLADNPKTSAITGLSIAAQLRKLLADMGKM
jgi:aspartate dehydrogenase